jgi:[ribosomal protein S5]-alanine N-acetyltransferase
MKLETQRLILRNWNEKDEKNLIQNLNNIQVSKWLLVVPYPYKKKDAKWWINHCKKNSKNKVKSSYQFAIEERISKKSIGGIGLSNLDEFQETADLGYWLGTSYHKRGYMTEALEAVLEFAFKKLKLRRIKAGVFLGNEASLKTLIKQGFAQEGLLRKAARSKASKEISDEIIVGLLKEDWEELRRMHGKK